VNGALTGALDALTWPQAGALAGGGAVLAVPLGSTEQHGPHLPLSTDTDIAVALCEGLARARGVVLAPAVPYGSSGEHAGFPGTLSIGQDALQMLVIELCRSATETFSRVLLVCGHGGNAEPLAQALVLLQFEGRDVRAWAPSWPGEPHAGRAETALQLALGVPVDMAHAEAGDTRPLAEVLPLLRSGGVRAVSPNGILGDPRDATHAEGRALLDRLTCDLLVMFDAWTAEEAASSAEATSSVQARS
jgi:mycofactocin precursor peptide peptidase